MTCSFCNNEMNAGKIRGSYENLFWLDDDKAKGLAALNPLNNIELTNGRIIGEKKLAGYICVKCKKIIVEYEDIYEKNV